MSDSFWDRINNFFGILCIGVLFALTVFLATIEIKDLDLWLHLAMGKFITLHGYVPTTDILSFTIPGKPWVNHEWAFQVLVYKIFSNWGAEGLIMMQQAVVCLTMLILLILGYDKKRQLVIAFTLLMVLLTYQLRFTYRPDLFSLLFFSLYIFILSLYIDRKWSVYALFVIQVIWSNFHGFFFFGPVFILIGILTEWVKRKIKLPYEWNSVGRLDDSEYTRLKQAFIFVVLACILNPLTFKGAWYPVRVFFELSGESKIFFKHILELQAPIAWGSFFAIDGVAHYKILIVVSLVTFIYNRRNIDIGALLFWVVFLFFSLKALRNIPFFAFAAYLVIVTNSLSLSFNDIFPFKFSHKKFKYVTEIAIKALLIFWMLEYGMNSSTNGYFDFDTFERKSEKGGITLRTYPDKAVKFLADNNIKGNIFNDFNSGAYLLGHVFPNIKVFIDGRTEVYGPHYFNNYQKAYERGDKELLDKILRDFNITIAFFNTVPVEAPPKTLRYFYNHKDWEVVYFDYDAVVFFKKSPEQDEAIKKFKMDLTKWKAEEFDLIRLGAKRITPYQHINRAYTLEALKLYDQAISEAEEALKIDPSFPTPYKLLGKIYGKRKEFEKSFENLRIASVLDPGSRVTRYSLAKAYYDLGEYSSAVYQYDKLIGHKPDDARAYFLKAKAYAKTKDYGKSLKVLQQAQEVDPGALEDVLLLGDVAYNHEDYEEALKIYSKAPMDKKDSKKLSKIYNRLGLTYRKMGNKEQAKIEFDKALKIDPDNEELKDNMKGL